LHLKRLTARTTRFTEVVNTAGKPELAYLWTDPAKDKPFMAAVRQKRVMTLNQETVGNRKDFGLVGFHPGKHASYLIFPKPLSAFNGRRIVGIKYDLLGSPQPMGRRVAPLKTPPAGRFKPGIKPTLQVSKKKAYKVTVRFTATKDVAEEVEAASRSEALETAIRQVQVPEFTHADVIRKVTQVRVTS
jgi:hypothetical protein